MRWASSQLSDRWVHHLLALFLVFAAATAGTDQQITPDFIEEVRAVQVTDPFHSTGLVTTPEASSSPPPDTPAPTATAEPTRKPLPTPVPIDPNATPLPGPPQTASPPPPPPPNPTVGMVWPVSGGWLSQYFSSAHPALDIAAPYGNAVVAAQSGTVTWAGWRNNGGGYVVEIDHGNGVITGYNHLSEFYVSPGDWVAIGTTIAAVGCTGLCTGPHVHFVLVVDGWYVNPLTHL